MIVGLTGHNASGKGEVANYLVSKGYAYHSLSDVIREEARRRGLDCSRENLIDVGNDLRARYGPSILARRIRERLTGKDVVDSIRNPYEVMELRKEKSFFLVGVDSKLELRFKRSLQRGRIGDGVSLKEFQDKEEKENSSNFLAQQLNECMKLADHIIFNNGTLEELHLKVNEFLTLLEKSS
ncbi:MAG: AAA family ATPase [Acidobacteriota bacterium]